MLRRAHIFLAVALFLLAVGAFVWVAMLSSSYQTCEAKYERYETDNDASKLEDRIKTMFECGGFFADENGSAITAFATIALVISTIGLWIVTGNSANAAKLAAEAAVAVALPVVVLHEILLYEKGEPSRGQPPRRIMEAAPARITFVDLTFKNYGKSPAHLIQIFAQHRAADILPPDPRYTIGADLRTGSVIEADGGEFTLRSPANFGLSEGQQDAIADGTAIFWVYGFLSFRDVFGKAHETRFCFRWWGIDPGVSSDTPPGFIEDGPEAYRRST
ncbi:MAG TPA: hypothetical protein VIJ62_12775 [Rhizomicrobium sp.]